MIIFFLNSILAFSFFIKKPNEDLYIGGSKLGKDPSFVNKVDADIFHLEEVPGMFGFNYIKSENNKVFDVAGFGTKLIFYAYNGGTNQHMELIFNHSGHFQIRALGKCINFSSVPIILEACSTSPSHDIDIINADTSLPKEIVKRYGEEVTLERIEYMVEKLVRGLEHHNKAVLTALNHY
ncbi:hypothetical protein TCON_0905 [Astathelohania contejeani]|uniref:Uncharacterized protein n=1 Tax=Astathelohania contejeani TaxID=164912 RepID=A0ABQ7I0A7_9MICR|nr:hypothetical protein TCON_0905 [Thelohania contejeani]